MFSILLELILLEVGRPAEACPVAPEPNYRSSYFAGQIRQRSVGLPATCDLDVICSRVLEGPRSAESH